MNEFERVNLPPYLSEIDYGAHRESFADEAWHDVEIFGIILLIVCFFKGIHRHVTATVVFFISAIAASLMLTRMDMTSDWAWPTAIMCLVTFVSFCKCVS